VPWEYNLYAENEKVRANSKQPGTLTCLDRLFPRNNFFGYTNQYPHLKPLLHHRKQLGEDFWHWKRDDPFDYISDDGIISDCWEAMNVPVNIPVSRGQSEGDDVIEWLGNAEELNIGNYKNLEYRLLLSRGEIRSIKRQREKT